MAAPFRQSHASQAAALDCQRFGHEDEGGHCGHCGIDIARLRQPVIPSGRIPPEPYPLTAAQFWSVFTSLSAGCAIFLAVGYFTHWWPAFVVAIVCPVLVVLGIIRLAADAVKVGER